METNNHLIWEEKYSVGVVEIDNQHKTMFAVINKLIDLVGTKHEKEEVLTLIDQLVEYKKNHFATEENYFKKFNYEKTEEHMRQHKFFNDSLEELKNNFGGDANLLAYNLIDFLEDWFVIHLTSADQEYKECFKNHGLK